MQNDFAKNISRNVSCLIHLNMLHAFYTFLNISLLVVLLEDMLQEPKDTEETREKKTEEVIEMQAIASASQKEMEIICALSVLIF